MRASAASTLVQLDRLAQRQRLVAPAAAQVVAVGAQQVAQLGADQPSRVRSSTGSGRPRGQKSRPSCGSAISRAPACAHRVQAAQLERQRRRHLVAGRLLRAGRLRQQQPRLQVGEPGRHHQVFGGQLQAGAGAPPPRRRGTDRRARRSRSAGGRPSGRAPAPAAGRAAPPSRRRRR